VRKLALIAAVMLSAAPLALSATLEITGGPDAPALLRIPAPASGVEAKPGQVVILTDENGKEIPAQAELAGLSGDKIELVLVRPAGMGKTLRVVRTQDAASAAYSARSDDKTVALTAGQSLIARYQLGLRSLEGKPNYDCANFFYPLCTPAGVVVSDDAPSDHFHHRSLFMAFTNFAWQGKDKTLKTDFWHYFKDPKTQIRPGKLLYARGGAVCATLAATHEYVIDGQVTWVQDVIARAARLSDAVNVLDLEYHITANEGEVELGKNFYSSLQFRGAREYKNDELVFTYADGRKHIDVNTDANASPFDRWFDMTGPIGGKMVGTTVAVAASTPKSRMCHARGVKGLNANFVLDGPVKLSPGQTLVCRYQIYMHDGPVDQARIAPIADWFNPGAQLAWK
jgi:hypothetical protein